MSHGLGLQNILMNSRRGGTFILNYHQLLNQLGLFGQPQTAQVILWDISQTQRVRKVLFIRIQLWITEMNRYHLQRFQQGT